MDWYLMSKNDHLIKSNLQIASNKSQNVVLTQTHICRECNKRNKIENANISINNQKEKTNAGDKIEFSTNSAVNTGEKSQSLQKKSNQTYIHDPLQNEIQSGQIIKSEA